MLDSFVPLFEPQLDADWLYAASPETPITLDQWNNFIDQASMKEYGTFIIQ